MDAKDFISTIYLGDRSCKGIEIDAWAAEVSVQVDVISRVRSADGNWNFYTEEDIENGRLVFTGAKKIFLDQNGYLPNDLINSLEAIDQEDGTYCFVLSVCSVMDDPQGHEAVIKIIAETVALRDPLKPNVLVVD